MQAKDSDSPAWLQGHAQQQASHHSAAPRKGSAPRQSAPRSQYKELGKQGFEVPQKWLYDGCKRREPVIDIDCKPPRIVRKVGWNYCIKCEKEFWSADVVRIRLCVNCKNFWDSSVCEKATKESDP